MENFSKNQLERYPIYLKYFKELEKNGIQEISSPKIADKLGYSQEQVRKDLQAISGEPGKPKRGRSVEQLISELRTAGYTRIYLYPFAAPERVRLIARTVNENRYAQLVQLLRHLRDVLRHR